VSCVARAAVAAFLVSLTLPSFAQQQEEVDIRVPRRETATEAEVKAAAQAALARRAVEEDGRVTYQQVLADPDNIELNFRYAKTQVAEGNLRGAAATLERILLIKPDLARVKLFYGIVLFRLDNLDEAERTLTSLKEVEMAPSLRAEVDEYLREIQKRRRFTRFGASLSLGYQFDTNRNAAPSSKTRLFGDAPLALTGTSRKRRDTSFLLIHGLDVVHDLGFQAGHQLIGSFDYFLGEQTSVDDLDVQSFAFDGGLVLKSALANLTTTGFSEHLMLSRETFVRTQGVTARLDRDLTRKLHLFASNRWGWEDFVGITENEAAPERRGNRDTFVTGAEYQLTPATQVSGNLGYERKGAKTDYNAYDGFLLGGSHLWLPGEGQFLINAISYGFNSYDGPDRAISAVTRQDKQLRTRVTYGAPLTFFFGRWADNWLLDDTTATLSFEYFRSLSTITNYTYRNFKSTMMVTRKVEF
jgi:hypothetical protein